VTSQYSQAKVTFYVKKNVSGKTKRRKQHKRKRQRMNIVIETDGLNKIPS